MIETNKTSEDPIEQRERFRIKTFRMMLQIAFVFGVPATLAVIVGSRLDSINDTGKTWTLFLLGVALALSWFVTIRIYLKLSREGKAVDKAVKLAKQNNLKSINDLDKSG